MTPLHIQDAALLSSVLHDGDRGLCVWQPVGVGGEGCCGGND